MPSLLSRSTPILIFGWLAVILFLNVASSRPALSNEVRSIGIAALSDGAVAVVIDATGAAAVSAIALRGPDRLVLDLPDVPYKASASEGAGRGFVARYRMGEAGALGSAGTRIVLDLESPALAESIEILPGASGARMIVRLIKTTEKEFAVAASQTTSGDIAATGSLGEGAAIAAAPTDAEQPDQTQPGERLDFARNGDLDDRVVIVIDPGHGGADPGAVTPEGITEKTVALDFAKALQGALNKTGRFRTVLTRDDDRFLSLDDRVKLARENKASLFISIHADTLSDEPGVRGSTVYTLADKASDARSARLAEKENAVDSLGGVASNAADAEVSDILFDLARRETRSFSNDFAGRLIRQLQESVKINKNPRRFARFRVLIAPDVPSVLLELGYLSSSEDAKLVTSPEWQAKAAAATTEAITEFAEKRLAVSQ